MKISFNKNVSLFFFLIEAKREKIEKYSFQFFLFPSASRRSSQLKQLCRTLVHVNEKNTHAFLQHDCCNLN